MTMTTTTQTAIHMHTVSHKGNWHNQAQPGTTRHTLVIDTLLALRPPYSLSPLPLKRVFDACLDA